MSLRLRHKSRSIELVLSDLPGLGSVLRHETLHLPLGRLLSASRPVVHFESITPPSVVKETAVPAGAGLLFASARFTVIDTGTLSVSHADGRKLLTEMLMLFCSGIPVDITSSLESVDIFVSRTVALTLMV